jgi:hypothetical protein
MLRDAVATRHFLKRTDKLPELINYGHPVSADPTGSPAYIDGQVADILVEIQEKPVSKFVEGDPVGTLPPVEPATVFGVDQKKFNAMMARVFTRHKKLPRKLRSLPYTLVRSVDGKAFHIHYVPALDGYRVKVIL